MLKNTFCHLKNIGPKKEKSFWEKNIFSWEDLLATLESSGNGHSRSPSCLKEELKKSFRHYSEKNAAYFADRLGAKETWRLFSDFRDSTAYLDIETTGLTDPEITTIALYDGSNIKYYVNGQNFEQFADDIANYKMIVTYNGKTFDVPIINHYFKMNLHPVHIDLRYVLKSLGYSGGLKQCEKKLGIARGDLDGVDGYFAVLLWNDYCRNKHPKTLETLLSYNIADVVNLEKLMVLAFNKKIKQNPHLPIDPVSDPISPPLPFVPDRATIQRIRRSNVGNTFY